MAAPGRPTPHRPGDGEPGFFDRRPEEVARPDLNPYLARHREFGPELLPAEDARAFARRWAEAFGRDAPLHVEIGAGNGSFLVGLAEANPGWNVLGVELRYKRVWQCAVRIRKAGVANARIARYHAAYLDPLFAPGSVAGLYVNHPDPWPKARHEKNRLISRWFLEDCARWLAPGGWLRIKSDFAPNVARAVELLDRGPDGEPLPALPFRVTGRADDVNSAGAPWPEDIPTHYQLKMRARGVPVHAVELVRIEG